ncbi:MAG: class I SAM-dependent RNA methyltransferase, partial [Deltaproteobacteria bacterium]|nr:class I SAM-dependent RNA methyltransferase [Deltaproteobacteria bacterium]
MFEYQRSSRYFAQVSDDMEALGVEELAGWGARHIRPVYRGIHF